MIFFVADATLVLATGWQRRFSIAENFQDEQKSLTKEQPKQFIEDSLIRELK
jgi:hypothetical protein